VLPRLSVMRCVGRLAAPPWRPTGPFEIGGSLLGGATCGSEVWWRRCRACDVTDDVTLSRDEATYGRHISGPGLFFDYVHLMPRCARTAASRTTDLAERAIVDNERWRSLFRYLLYIQPISVRRLCAPVAGWRHRVCVCVCIRVSVCALACAGRPRER